MPSNNWKKDGARFVAYVHNSTNNDYKWYSMTYDKALSCYSFTLTLSDGYNEVIFYRMNGSTTDNKLDNKWNQTPGNNSGYESLPTDGKNCYILNDGWDDCGGSWSTK